MKKPVHLGDPQPVLYEAVRLARGEPLTPEELQVRLIQNKSYERVVTCPPEFGVKQYVAVVRPEVRRALRHGWGNSG